MTDKKSWFDSSTSHKVFGDMFYAYVFYSPEHKKIYIGYTSDLGQRILPYNDIRSKGWTRSFQPWKLVLNVFK